METPEARLTPANPEERQVIIEAIDAYAHELNDPDLSALSSNTVVEALDANPLGVFMRSGNDFEAVGSVYAKLNYPENVSMTEEFPVLVKGRVLPGSKVEIENVKVDTSSFYD